MENTQNKIYEIEESALFDQSVKNQIESENKHKNDGLDTDVYNYGDQFDDNLNRDDAQDEKKNETPS